MGNNENVLFVIDMQNDFIADRECFELANYVYNFTPDITSNLKDYKQKPPVLAAYATDLQYVKNVADFISSSNWTYIYASHDFHPDNHCSFKAFPKHCVQGTIGWLPHPLIHGALSDIEKKQTQPRGEVVPTYKGFDKTCDSYAAYHDPDCTTKEQKRNKYSANIMCRNQVLAPDRDQLQTIDPGNLKTSCEPLSGENATLKTGAFRNDNIMKESTPLLINYCGDVNKFNYDEKHPPVIIREAINRSKERLKDFEKALKEYTEGTIDEILSCERTISSSLHGVIVSHTYDIPSVWVKFSNKLFGNSPTMGNNIKFRDYFTSVGIESYNGVDYINKDIDLNTIIELVDNTFKNKNRIVEFDFESLMSSCPYI